MGKYLHNYFSFAFVLGLVLIFCMWVMDNFPHPATSAGSPRAAASSATSIRRPAKFNVGQKIIFWSTILGGLALAVTGYMLMFPFYSCLGMPATSPTLRRWPACSPCRSCTASSPSS